MKVIEITEKKLDKLASHVEDALMSLGNVMHCIEEMNDELVGERRRGYRQGEDMYGGRVEKRRWDEDEMVGERRYMRR